DEEHQQAERGGRDEQQRELRVVLPAAPRGDRPRRRRRGGHGQPSFVVGSGGLAGGGLAGQGEHQALLGVEQRGGEAARGEHSAGQQHGALGEGAGEPRRGGEMAGRSAGQDRAQPVGGLGVQARQLQARVLGGVRAADGAQREQRAAAVLG